MHFGKGRGEGMKSEVGGTVPLLNFGVKIHSQVHIKHVNHSECVPLDQINLLLDLISEICVQFKVLFPMTPSQKLTFPYSSHTSGIAKCKL